MYLPDSRTVWHTDCLGRVAIPTAKTMDTFSPEFAQYWLAGQSEAASDAKVSGRGEDSPSASQREAFEALAERVVAARSIL